MWKLRLSLFIVVWALATLLSPDRPAQASTWQTLASPGFNCRTADFIDLKRGWVGGDNWTALPSTMQWKGLISRTDTGGESWVGSGNWDFLFVNDLDFLDGSRGWAVLDDGTIVSSSNGGSEWAVQAEGSFEYRDNNWTYKSVSMADATHGCAVGSWVGFIGVSYPRIVYTQNGSEWKAADLPKPAGGWLESVCMVDPQYGWAVGSAGAGDRTPLVLVTGDGGATWTRQMSGLPATGVSLHGVWFVDRQHGWAVGDSGTICTTSDGGSTWNTQSSGVSTVLYGVRFADSTTGWVVGEKGTILETAQAGDPWVLQSPPTTETLRAVAAAGGSVWAVGDLGVVVTASGAPGDRFSDIGSSPYKTAIQGLASADIVNGFPDGTFRPALPATRQQFAKMIDLTLGLTVPDGFEPFPFSDVPRVENDPYPDDYIGVAWKNGLVEGTGAGRFSPSLNITRAQLLTIVVRAALNMKAGALGEPPAGWVGALPATDETHGKNIARAEYGGLLAGIDLTGFDVWGEATRGEVAQVLWNLKGK